MSQAKQHFYERQAMNTQTMIASGFLLLMTMLLVFRKSKRSAAAQRCLPSAGGSSGTLAVERGEPQVSTEAKVNQPADSLAHSSEKAARALVEIWKSEQQIWEEHARLYPESILAEVAPAYASVFSQCARDLDAALQPGARPAAGERAFPTNDGR
jgi:hypothetical protein